MIHVSPRADLPHCLGGAAQHTCQMFRTALWLADAASLALNFSLAQPLSAQPVITARDDPVHRGPVSRLRQSRPIYCATTSASSPESVGGIRTAVPHPSLDHRIPDPRDPREARFLCQSKEYFMIQRRRLQLLPVFIGFLFSLIPQEAISRDVADTDTKSDKVFWDVNHYDYRLKVTAKAQGTCVSAASPTDEPDEELQDFVCINRSCTASCTGTCTVTRSGGGLGRLFGWDLISEVPSSGCEKQTTRKIGTCHKTGKFASFVFYFGRVNTISMTAEAIVKCE